MNGVGYFYFLFFFWLLSAKQQFVHCWKDLTILFYQIFFFSNNSRHWFIFMAKRQWFFWEKNQDKDKEIIVDFISYIKKLIVGRMIAVRRPKKVKKDQKRPFSNLNLWVKGSDLRCVCLFCLLYFLKITVKKLLGTFLTKKKTKNKKSFQTRIFDEKNT